MAPIRFSKARAAKTEAAETIKQTMLSRSQYEQQNNSNKRGNISAGVSAGAKVVAAKKRARLNSSIDRRGGGAAKGSAMKPGTKKKATTNPRKLLEQAFGKLNVDLAKRNLSDGNVSLADQRSFNIFTDIMKIAPVIDLVEEEAEEDDEVVPDSWDGGEELLYCEETDEETLRTRNGPTLEENAMEQQQLAPREVPSDMLQMSMTSDIDLREKPTLTRKRKATIAKPAKKKQMVKIKQELLSSQSAEDLDIREKSSEKSAKAAPCPAEPASMESSQPCCSSSLAPVTTAPSNNNPQQPICSSPSEPFTSRVRLARPSPPIDLGQNYHLHGIRYFQQIQGRDVASPNAKAYRPLSLDVVSFNVLCQRSMEKTGFLYPHLGCAGGRVPAARWVHGQWEERQKKLEDEFNRLAADVFCLQEVQDVHYEAFFKPYFLSRGYQCFYTGRNGLDTPDGCATFWLDSKFHLLVSHPIAYNLGVPGMDRDNVGQIVVLGLLGTRTSLCITNTHIYYNMKRGEVKLAQMAYLLGKMHQVEAQIRAGLHSPAVLSTQFTAKKRPQTPPKYGHFAGHILCGDFNMAPGSALHRFLLNRHIDLTQQNGHMLAFSTDKVAREQLKQQSICNYLDRPWVPVPKPLALPVRRMRLSAECTFVEEDESIHLKCGSELRHGHKFASVYEHWNAVGEPEVSTYHKQAENPDFILYSVNNSQRHNVDERGKDAQWNEGQELAHESFIQLRRRLSIPTRRELDKACGPMPNEQYGSDHLSLLATFHILCLPPNSGRQ